MSESSPARSTPAVPHPLDASGVLVDVKSEYDRAKQKHGENTLDGALSSDLTRLAALVEEVGEVAELLTYDQARMYSAERLRAELLQVANVALTWASVL